MFRAFPPPLMLLLLLLLLVAGEMAFITRGAAPLRGGEGGMRGRGEGALPGGGGNETCWRSYECDDFCLITSPRRIC